MEVGKQFGALVTILAIMALAGAASAQGRGGGNGSKPSFDQLLASFDANRDGALQQSEVPSRMWSQLSKADTNRDGYVTRAEYDAGRR